MSSYESNNHSFGPDWLRNKPVFSKHRWGQEELLGLSQNVGDCPQSLLAMEDLAAPSPLPPVNYTQFTEEEKELFERGNVQSSERGRGRARGTTRGGGTRRSYESNYNSRREDSRDNSRSADCDNWRRRDPDPPREDLQSANSTIPPSSRPSDVPEPGFLSRSPPSAGVNEPPYYPPFPSKTSAPPTYPPFPGSAATLGSKPNIDHTESDTWRRENALVGAVSKDNNAAILRNISQSLDSPPQLKTTEYPPFSSSSQDLAPGNISSLLPSSGPSLDMFINREPSSPSQSFPSLRELGVTQPLSTSPIIGAGMSPTAVQPEIRGQGFLPPPAPPSSFLPPPAPQVSEEEDTKWFYLDPKKNTQGPFSSIMMFNWFSQGYFGMNLEIRRAEDVEFKKLEDVIRDSGKIPFQPDEPTPVTSTPQPIQPIRAPEPVIEPKRNVWDTGPSQSIWGSEPVTSSYPASTSTNHTHHTYHTHPGSALPNLTPAFSGHDFLKNHADEAKRALRAEEMRKEIERAMAAEQQRKLVEEEEEKRQLRAQTEQQRLQNEQFVLEQQRLMQVKRQAETRKEAELSRLRELENIEKKRLEEEAEELRLQKERLEAERAIQEERNRQLREDSDRERREIEERRHAMEQERLKLEREKEMIRQQEEDLKRKAMEKERARITAERSAAMQAAAEAKAAVEAQAASERAAAERRAIVQRENAERAKAAAEAERKKEAAKKQNAWGAVNNTSSNPGAPSPWATQATPQMTSSATRTSTPSSNKGWAKPAPPKGPSLSEIQKTESQNRASAPKAQQKQQQAMQQGTWAKTAGGGNSIRSLADIQKEQESFLEHQENINYARNNSWNPVAGMLEEDQPKPKPKAQPVKPAAPQPKKGKSTQNNKHTPALMEMFSNSPRDEFTVWCETQVKAFKNLHIDVPTFISFLRDVESPIEVREYVINFLGDTKATDDFVKDFVIKRKSMNNNNAAANNQEAKAKEPQITSSRKNRKKKMQKVNAAALLGINCTASSDARNRGDIDNVIIQ